MKKNLIPPLAELVELAWLYLDPIQRLALLLTVTWYSLENLLRACLPQKKYHWVK